MENLYKCDAVRRLSPETVQESIKQRIMIYGLIHYVNIDLDIAAKLLGIPEVCLTAVYEGKILLVHQKFLQILQLMAIYAKPLPPDVLVS